MSSLQKSSLMTSILLVMAGILFSYQNTSPIDIITDMNVAKNIPLKKETINNYKILINESLEFGELVGYKLGLNQGDSLIKKLNTVMEYVSTDINYIEDNNLTSGAKHAKRTVANGNGDCEDKMILSASILESLDVDVYMVRRQAIGNQTLGHIYLAIPIDKEELILNKKNVQLGNCKGIKTISFDASEKNSIVGFGHESLKITNGNTICYQNVGLLNTENHINNFELDAN
jgi:hypothetical protein